MSSQQVRLRLRQAGILILSITALAYLLCVHAPFIHAEESLPTDPPAEEETAAAPAAADPEPESVDISATTTDDAAVVNEVAAEASTGGNEVSSSPAAVIETGDAAAEATVVNVVNVNIFDSEALMAFLSKFSDGDATSVDMRGLEYGYDGSLGCKGCAAGTSSLASASSSAMNSEGGAALSSAATSTARISNAVVVRSGTGGNRAEGDDGAAISTGNAYAAANVVNVANSTFVDSRYLMFMLNNYGDWNGDLVLPSSSFFERFLNAGPASGAYEGGLVLNMDNDASMDTAADATADTGGNEASSSSDGAYPSLVETGSAHAGTTVINEANQTHLGGSAVAIVFRLFGDWTGKAFNLPPGFSMRRTDTGMELISTPVDAGFEGSDDDIAKALSLSASRKAEIVNDVSVSASTGDNTASSTDGEAAISTGDAYAAANVVNVANVTTVGRNWITAIVNIFGDWGGNISFGQPNLWVGTRAEFVGKNGPGGEIRYTYTVKNNGDAPAHAVRLSHSFGSTLATLAEAGGPAAENSWELGELDAGQSVELSRTAFVTEDLPYGDSAISSTIEVAADESDGDPADNTDVISVVASRPAPGSHNHPDTSDDNPPWFFVSATNDARGPVEASSTVNYSVTIENRGGIAHQTVLADEISRAGAGTDSAEVVHAEEWNLGEVMPKESITVSYEVFFNGESKPGVYVNKMKLYSASGSFRETEPAASEIRIVARPAPGAPAAGGPTDKKEAAGWGGGRRSGAGENGNSASQPASSQISSTSAEISFNKLFPHGLFAASSTRSGGFAGLAGPGFSAGIDAAGGGAALAAAVWSAFDPRFMYWYLALLILLGAAALVWYGIARRSRTRASARAPFRS